MKIIFSLLGVFIGASIGNWPGAVYGFFIGLLAGTLIQVKERINKIEEGVNLIRENLVASKTEIRPPEKEQIKDEEVINSVHKQEIWEESISPVSVAEIKDTDIPAPVEAPLEKEQHEQGMEGPAAPPPPDYLDRSIIWLKQFFTTGNVVVKVGVIVLIVGIGFLLKYAADRNAFPIELRLAVVAAAGIAMLVFGWRLRHKNRNYALVLQGGAVGVLYMTVFAAAKLYTVIPLFFAFGVMFALVVFSCFMAVLQDSRSLACFATIGGFLAPVLTSSGTVNTRPPIVNSAASAGSPVSTA